MMTREKRKETLAILRDNTEDEWLEFADDAWDYMDAFESERDALKAKLAEIEGWLKKPDCLSVCVDYLLARFFSEDA